MIVNLPDICVYNTRIYLVTIILNIQPAMIIFTFVYFYRTLMGLTSYTLHEP
jgi:hypothetical protein